MPERICESRIACTSFERLVSGCRESVARSERGARDTYRILLLTGRIKDVEHLDRLVHGDLLAVRILCNGRSTANVQSTDAWVVSETDSEK